MTESEFQRHVNGTLAWGVFLGFVFGVVAFLVICQVLLVVMA